MREGIKNKKKNSLVLGVADSPRLIQSQKILAFLLNSFYKFAVCIYYLGNGNIKYGEINSLPLFNIS